MISAKENKQWLWKVKRWRFLFKNSIAKQWLGEIKHTQQNVWRNGYKKVFLHVFLKVLMSRRLSVSLLRPTFSTSCVGKGRKVWNWSSTFFTITWASCPLTNVSPLILIIRSIAIIKLPSKKRSKRHHNIYFRWHLFKNKLQILSKFPTGFRVLRFAYMVYIKWNVTSCLPDLKAYEAIFPQVLQVDSGNLNFWAWGRITA